MRYKFNPFTGNLDNVNTKDEEINISKIGDATWTTQEHFNNLFGSAGRATGGQITDAGSQTINVSSGTGFIKATDSDTASLLSFNWDSTSGISIPSNSVVYVGVKYGTHSAITTKSSNTWDLDTEFPLGSVINQDGDLYTMNNPWWVTDGMTNIIERFQAMGYTVRDNYVGGLIIGTSGTNTTRKPTLTSGTVWSRLNEFLITEKNCSTGDTFYGFYRDGATGWSRTVAKTDIDDYYDDNSGTLQPLNNNKYVNFWIFLDINGGGGNGKLMIIYPQTQYNSASEAESGNVPVFPTSWYEHGILLGRIIIKQGVTSPIAIQTSFNTNFGYALAADHGNLSGLTDNDHPQYLLTSSTLNNLVGVSTGTPSDKDILTYNTSSGKWTASAAQSGTASDHAALSHLNWADSGHTIDTDVDFDDNQGINFVHETVSSLPSVVTGKVVYLNTDDHLYLGIN